MNAPMVAPEVLRELQPYVGLADGLGRAAVQLVEDSGFSDVFITYHRWVKINGFERWFEWWVWGSGGGQRLLDCTSPTTG